eukprot:TRINITY_DN21459_c0_g1_i1.p1 TRINITY_DN21459_c0_g1~~TRINITY_DN21459_c0_g1_i1.p1  ORF type:complete len:115 (+),score=9.65 TRINITY_DN21459_c0_g1_i1:290-634(+)
MLHSSHAWRNELYCVVLSSSGVPAECGLCVRAPFVLSLYPQRQLCGLAFWCQQYGSAVRSSDEMHHAVRTMWRDVAKYRAPLAAPATRHPHIHPQAAEVRFDRRICKSVQRKQH